VDVVPVDVSPVDVVLVDVPVEIFLVAPDPTLHTDRTIPNARPTGRVPRRNA